MGFPDLYRLILAERLLELADLLKNDNSVIIYSSLCHSKPVLFPCLHETKQDVKQHFDVSLFPTIA